MITYEYRKFSNTGIKKTAVQQFFINIFKLLGFYN